MHSNRFSTAGVRSGFKCCSLLFALVSLTFVQAQQPSAACKLLQPAELESALGGKAGKFADLGDGSMCYEQIGSLKVLIRTGKRQGDEDGVREWRAIELARAQGFQIEVKTDGELTCSTYIPPASKSQVGFNTTCSILHAGRVIAVEVTAPSQKEMASMDVVRKLAQKVFTRL
ncbi:MAG: hypothetical protein C4291_07270 [Candidatus Dadabacteria bacterium]